jgi:hypothetical protein
MISLIENLVGLRIKRQAFDILTVFAGVAIVSARHGDCDNRLILAMKLFSRSFSINMVPVIPAQVALGLPNLIIGHMDI